MHIEKNSEVFLAARKGAYKRLLLIRRKFITTLSLTVHEIGMKTLSLRPYKICTSLKKFQQGRLPLMVAHITDMYNNLYFFLHQKIVSNNWLPSLVH